MKQWMHLLISAIFSFVTSGQYAHAGIHNSLGGSDQQVSTSEMIQVVVLQEQKLNQLAKTFIGLIDSIDSEKTQLDFLNYIQATGLTSSFSSQVIARMPKELSLNERQSIFKSFTEIYRKLSFQQTVSLRAVKNFSLTTEESNQIVALGLEAESRNSELLLKLDSIISKAHLKSTATSAARGLIIGTVSALTIAAIYSLLPSIVLLTVAVACFATVILFFVGVATLITLGSEKHLLMSIAKTTLLNGTIFSALAGAVLGAIQGYSESKQTYRDLEALRNELDRAEATTKSLAIFQMSAAQPL